MNFPFVLCLATAHSHSCAHVLYHTYHTTWIKTTHTACASTICHTTHTIHMDNRYHIPHTCIHAHICIYILHTIYQTHTTYHIHTLYTYHIYTTYATLIPNAITIHITHIIYTIYLTCMYHIHHTCIHHTSHIPATHTYTSHVCARISGYRGLHPHTLALLWFCWPVCSAIMTPLWLIPFVGHVLCGNQARRPMCRS